MAGKKKRRNRRQKLLEEDSEAKLLERIAKIKALLDQEDVDEDDPQNYYHFTDSSDEEKLESQNNKKIRLGSSYSSTIRSLFPESETYDEVNTASLKHSTWGKQPFYCSLVNPLSSIKYPHSLKNYFHANEMPNPDVYKNLRKTSMNEKFIEKSPEDKWVPLNPSRRRENDNKNSLEGIKKIDQNLEKTSAKSKADLTIPKLPPHQEKWINDPLEKKSSEKDLVLELKTVDVSCQDERTNILPEAKERNIAKNIVQTLKKTPTELTFSACVSIAAEFPDEALMALKCLQIPLLQNQIEYQPEIITIEDSNSGDSRRASEEREINKVGEKENNKIIDPASVSRREKISKVLANYLDGERFHTNIKTASTCSDKSPKPSVEEFDDRNKQTVDFSQEIEKFLMKLRMIKTMERHVI